MGRVVLSRAVAFESLDSQELECVLASWQGWQLRRIAESKPAAVAEGAGCAVAVGCIWSRQYGAAVAVWLSVCGVCDAGGMLLAACGAPKQQAVRHWTSCGWV
jgi:hypothetical protein